MGERSGPYIVTTKRGVRGTTIEGGKWWNVSRRAVATLEEALGVLDWVRQQGVLASDHISNAGGTFSLPDGTVIEVRPWHIAQVAAAALVANDFHFGELTQVEVIDAFNAQEARE